MAWSTVALAQERDPAAAEALFARAREELVAGDEEEACRLFEASLALDPTASSQVKVARCHARRGRVASAWVGYLEARKLNRATAVPAHREEIEAVITAEIHGLEARVPTLRLLIADRPAGLEVERDGVLIPLAALDEPLPVDPGVRTIVARAPGHVAMSRTLTIVDGEHAVVELGLVIDGASTRAPVRPGRVATSSHPDGSARSTLTVDAPGAGGSRLRAGSYVAFGAGGALGAVAVGLGIATWSLVADSNGECSAADVCSTRGIELRDDARSLQTAAIGLGLAGAAAVATGVVLILVDGPAESKLRARTGRLALRLGPRAVSVEGGWP